MDVDLFDFTLPADRIAQRPVRPRDAARLLEIRAGRQTDHVVRDLPDLLRPGDLLVFNDTRVIPARLTARRGQVAVELTLHRQIEDTVWRALAKPGKRLKPGHVLDLATGGRAEVLDKGPDGDVGLRFDCGAEALMEALKRSAAVPLPPYIRGGTADDRDAEDYQTVYAAQDGAVAAPTAGLHFTPELMARLDARGIGRAFATLHVGAGTFLPVKAGKTEDHRMHPERGVISEATAESLNRIRAGGGRIVAVGTTSLRLLESAADPDGRLHPFDGDTDLFVTPGYRFRFVDLLLTNFHLPRSTLFMLTAAFAGLETMKAAYRHALDAGYRFYSYGDCCLLHPQEES